MRPSRRVKSDITKPLPPGLLNRKAFLERTGIQDHELRRLAREGRVKASHRDGRGNALWTEDDAIRVHQTITARLRRNDLESVTFTATEACAVFKKIREGIEPDVIMIDLNLHPFQFEAIKREYERVTGAITIPKAYVDQINKLPIEGTELPIRKPEQIVEALALASKERSCVRCRRRAASKQCATCIRTHVEKELASKGDPAETKDAAAE